MAREDLHFRLRIPEELKDLVSAAADESRRSMTAEIIARLEQTFEKRDRLEREYAGRYIAVLESENDALKKSQVLLEQLLFSFAHALRKASTGDSSSIDALIEQEKERSLLKKISEAAIDLSEG